MTILFYAFAFTPLGKRILAASAIGNAHVAKAILDRLGEDTRLTQATISSAKCAIEVLPSCSALEFLLFLGATVIAFPAPTVRKISGFLIGSLLLLALNQVRITSVYCIGAHFPGYFEVAHEDFWSMALIIAEIILCAAWIGWARKINPSDDHAAA